MTTGWTPLPEPRRLTAGEQGVLDRLVGHADCAELRDQAASVWVTASCDCGCSSVRLRSDAPALSPAQMTRLSSTGRDDWFAIDYTRFDEATAADASTGCRMLQIVVHVVAGSLHELEIFVEEGVAVEPPAPNELNDIHVI